MIQSWLPGDIVHNFESIPPVIYNKRVLRDVFYSTRPKDAPPVIPLFQIRDFLNYAASWTKHKLNKKDAHRWEAVTVMYDMWMDMAREAYGETNYIKGPKYILDYDRFVQEREYRQKICDMLGGQYNEKLIDNIPANSPGSSFDKYNYQGRGQEMDVLNRWRWFLSDEGAPFISYLRDSREVIEYYADHTNLDEGKKDFVNLLLR